MNKSDEGEEGELSEEGEIESSPQKSLPQPERPAESRPAERSFDRSEGREVPGNHQVHSSAHYLLQALSVLTFNLTVLICGFCNLGSRRGLRTCARQSIVSCATWIRPSGQCISSVTHAGLWT